MRLTRLQDHNRTAFRRRPTTQRHLREINAVWKRFTAAVAAEEKATRALKDRENATVVLGIEKMMWPQPLHELRIQIHPDYFLTAVRMDSRRGEFNDVGYRAGAIAAEVSEKVQRLLLEHARKH